MNAQVSGSNPVNGNDDDSVGDGALRPIPSLPFGLTDVDDIIVTINSIPPVEPKPFNLKFHQKICIASGHFLNDLTAALWFSYLLLYFEYVVGFNDEDNASGSEASKYAAALMLVGQLVDGFATPIVGYGVDHAVTCTKKYGRCKTWHLAGSLMVLFSFPFIFSPVIGESPDSNLAPWVKIVYYIPFIAIFQIGWASVQISHLALIPKMHPNELVRTELFSIRYAFTVLANLIIFIMTWIKLKYDQDLKKAAKDCTVNKSHTNTFMIIALVAVGLGLLCTIFFHIGVIEDTDSKIKEKFSSMNINEDLNSRLSQNDEDGSSVSQPNSTDVKRRSSMASSSKGNSHNDEDKDNESPKALIDEHSVEERLQAEKVKQSASNTAVISKTSILLSTISPSIGTEKMTVKDWFKLPQAYIVAFIYMASRLSINLGQVYIPLYVQESLRIPCTSVATIPLTMYISGFVLSTVLKALNKYLGRQITYLLGASLAVIGSVLVILLDWDGPDSNVLKTYIIYVVAVFLGSGAATILVTSLSITADLIGKNIESGAFVYGTMSFCDKLSCGLSILAINSFVPCPGPTEASSCKAKNVPFYRNVLGYSVGGSAVFGAIGVFLLTYQIHRLNIRMKQQEAIANGPQTEIS